MVRKELNDGVAEGLISSEEGGVSVMSSDE